MLYRKYDRGNTNIMAYRCTTCNVIVPMPDIKYHTADRSKVFCGAQCSLTYFQQLKELKEKENGE